MSEGERLVERPMRAAKPSHPIQPLEYDDEGVLRFKRNAIVQFMLNAGRNGWKFDLNALAEMPFSDEDRQQLAQLLGYSLSGYGELSYVDDEAYDAADRLGAVIRGEA